MGNNYCCETSNRYRDVTSPKERRSNKIKRELIQMARAPSKQFHQLNQSENSQRFMHFHRITLCELIIHYQFPVTPKDFNIDGYFNAFESVNYSEGEKTMSRCIRQDIEASGSKSIFSLIVQEFHNFYEDLINNRVVDYQSPQKLVMSPQQHSNSMADTKKHRYNSNCFKSKTLTMEDDMIYQETQITRRNIAHIFTADPYLSEMFLLSTVTLFALLKSSLLHLYSDVIRKIPTNIDNYIKRDMFLQKIVQHFIYDQKFTMSSILEMSIQHYYSNSNKNLQLECTYLERPDRLDKTLYPEMVQITAIREIEDDSWIEDQSPIKDDLRSSSKMSFLNLQNQVIDAITTIEKQNIPYKELFKFFQELIEERKPFRIYQQIECLNGSIVHSFMQNRPEEQLEVYRGIISTEDNMLSILLFLLYKFKEHTGCDLRKRLFNKLRFMLDFDQVLDKRIKYELDQSFLRFYACLEMIVETSYI